MVGFLSSDGPADDPGGLTGRTGPVNAMGSHLAERACSGVLGKSFHWLGLVTLVVAQSIMVWPAAAFQPKQDGAIPVSAEADLSGRWPGDTRNS